jgi:hypothetical protein
LRALDRLIAGEKHIHFLGACCSGIFGLLDGARGPFLAVAAMVMWVLLAVGRWLLAVVRLVLLLAQILHNCRNSINVHTQHIFSSLKYLDRSKIYSACPDMLNKI